MTTCVSRTTYQLQIAQKHHWISVDCSEFAMPWLRAAVILAGQNQIEHALNEAMQAWLQKTGTTEDVAFRVAVKTEAYYAYGPYQHVMQTPDQLHEDMAREQSRYAPEPPDTVKARCQPHSPF